MTTKFFNQRFWQNLLIAALSQLIVLCIAIFVSMYIGGTLEKMTNLFESIDSALTRVESVVTNLDPVEVAAKAAALNSGAEAIGDGIGSGGASVVDKVGAALTRFRNNDDCVIQETNNGRLWDCTDSSQQE